MHSTLYSYIPFCLIAITNTVFIIHLRVKKNIVSALMSSLQKQKFKSLNKTVIVLTSLFIVMTMPGTLASIYYDQLVQSEVGMVLLNLGDLVDNMYHSLNFLILAKTNTRIYKKVRSLLFKNKLNIIQSSSQSKINTMIKH